MLEEKKAGVNEPRANALNQIRRKNQEMQVRDRLHQQRWNDSLKKREEIEVKKAELMQKKKQIEDENAVIWKEIANLRSRIPGYDFAGLNVAEKKAFFKDGEVKPLAQGSYEVSKDLVTNRPYRGPAIKPQIPNHVADQMTYKDIINE